MAGSIQPRRTERRPARHEPEAQDEAAFWAEYQNDPLPEDVPDENALSVDDIATKTNGL
jgi:hypothetical protein